MGRVALSLLIFLVLSLPVVAQTDQQIASVQLERQQFEGWGYLMVSANPKWRPVLTAQDAAGLEEQLSHDPENVGVRIRLLNYYWHSQLGQRRTLTVFWLIEHHPDSPILALDIAWLFPNSRMVQVHDDEDFIRARQLWESAIAQRPNVPEVLHNAARFLEAIDPERAESLAKQLQQVDPEGHGKVLAYYFTRLAPQYRR